MIRINSLETQTDKGEQLGFMLLFQGMYKAIRNPRNHNLIVDKKHECDSILVFLNYLLTVIERSKPIFDYLDILNTVNDFFFTQTDEYAEEIIGLIPQDKMLDVALKLCSDIKMNNYLNIPYIVIALKKKFTEKEKIRF